MREVAVSPLAFRRLRDAIGAERLAVLEQLAVTARTEFAGRRVWNVNSTASGGGVAEMLKQVVSYSRAADVDARWLVMEGSAPFFDVTKRLHNRLHGERGDGGPLGPAEADLYRSVTAQAGSELAAVVGPGDVVILHDPQPLGAATAARAAGAGVVWRCHIGSDKSNELSREGWAFLESYADCLDETVVSRAAYKPPFCGPEDCVVIAPGIDPLSPKNAPMSDDVAAAVVEGIGVFAAAGLHRPAPTFQRENGSLDEVRRPAEVFGADGRPVVGDRVVVQVSRWDRLKDMAGVMTGFAEGVIAAGVDAWLVLAGPATAGVVDDPEGARVYAECQDRWRAMSDAARRRVLLVSLPMADPEENAAMVNALQRLATVVTQKSLKEGFGLTVAEAMWKQRAVVASAVGGIVDQVSDGTGVLVSDPADLPAFGTAVAGLLRDVELAARLGSAARERVRERFLPDRQLSEWAAVLTGVVARASAT